MGPLFLILSLAFQFLINAQFLNGIITAIPHPYLLILASRRRLLGDAANGPVYQVVATVCVIIVAIMAVAALAVTVLGWFGIG